MKGYESRLAFPGKQLIRVTAFYGRFWSNTRMEIINIDTCRPIIDTLFTHFNALTFIVAYLGICSAISSRLSDGLIGVFSNSRDGASVRWPVESLTQRNTLPPRRCRWRCCSADFLRLFSCSRCRLCRRKKNIDMLTGRTDRFGWDDGRADRNRNATQRKTDKRMCVCVCVADARGADAIVNEMRMARSKVVGLVVFEAVRYFASHRAQTNMQLCIQNVNWSHKLCEYDTSTCKRAFVGCLWIMFRMGDFHSLRLCM